jgi:hypothetical protein
MVSGGLGRLSFLKDVLARFFFRRATPVLTNGAGRKRESCNASAICLAFLRNYGMGAPSFQNFKSHKS